MGRRRLLVTAELWIEALKLYDGQPRAFEILRNPLPDDARVVDQHHEAGGVLSLVLESDAWVGTDDAPLSPTEFQVRFDEAVPAGGMAT